MKKREVGPSPAAPPIGPKARVAGTAGSRDDPTDVGSAPLARIVLRAFSFSGERETEQEAEAIADKRTRINEQIRISPIRLIDDEGNQVGIVALEEARQRAEEKSLDLVEVAPDARPPVVRMMDYGKFKYEEARAARDARKKQHTIQVKEVKFRPGIEEHDYEFKMRHARRFLEEGNKVKLTMMFRGRQVTHPELGMKVLERVTGDLQDIAKVESFPSFEGRQMSMVLAPQKTK
jgi:translation initiation factor IF-3